MSGWDEYEARIDARGVTRRGASLDREKRYIATKLMNNLSYHKAIVEGEDRDVAILNSDNLNQKHILSLPGEDLKLGALVEWMDNYWLISEKDANRELYTKCVMLQCNYILRWVDGNDIIHEQWCIVEDGTKYLTGEYEDRNFVVTRGDSRIAVTIARNEHTAKLCRDSRFLIDDSESNHMLAYALTKPLKVGGVYNGEGIYKFVLQEVNTTDTDNLELGIADYYKHFPGAIDHRPLPDVKIDPDGTISQDGKKVWL